MIFVTQAYAQSSVMSTVSATVVQTASVNTDGTFTDPTISPQPMTCNSDGTVTTSDGQVTTVICAYDGNTEIFYY